MARTRVLVVDHDLDNLSKIYLTLVHRNFKAEASNNLSETEERLKRMKPAVVILNAEAFVLVKHKLKIPAIVLLETGQTQDPIDDPEIVFMQKPVSMELLIKKLEGLVV